MGATLAGLGVGGNFVLGVACIGQQGLSSLFDVGEVLIIGQAGRVVVEPGIGFKGELIVGNVRGGKCNGLAHVGFAIQHALAGQAVHQVKIEVAKACGMGRFGGSNGFAPAVNASEGLKLDIVKALHADGEAVDAQGAEVAEFANLDCAGVGL